MRRQAGAERLVPSARMSALWQRVGQGESSQWTGYRRGSRALGLGLIQVSRCPAYLSPLGDTSLHLTLPLSLALEVLDSSADLVSSGGVSGT